MRAASSRIKRFVRDDAVVRARLAGGDRAASSDRARFVAEACARIWGTVAASTWSHSLCFAAAKRVATDPVPVVAARARCSDASMSSIDMAMVPLSIESGAIA